MRRWSWIMTTHSKTGARRGWWEALATYKHPPVLAMLFLGFSAGLPFLLVFSTLSAWLALEDVSRTTIGLFSWVGITYSIKIFWAPVVDRLPLPILTRVFGRRRSWMLLAQLGIGAGLFGLAISDPHASLEQVALLALLVAFSSATQDIAVDAWRIEAAPLPLQGAMAAAYQLGYRVALIVAGAGALILADVGGWSMAYLVMCACAGVGVLTTLVIWEPDSHSSHSAAMLETRAVDFMQRNAHWPQTLRNGVAWLIGAVVCPFLDFFNRNGVKLALLILAFIGLFRVTDITMGVMANPFYLDMGYTLTEIGAVAKLYGVAMSMLAVLIGGVVVFRYGALPILLVSGVLVIFTNLGFAVLAHFDHPGISGLIMVISADNFSAGLAGTAFIAYLSGLTNTAYTATQYALFSSLFTLPGKIMAGGSGWVVDHFGYTTFFLYTSALGLPALALLLLLMRHLPVEEKPAKE